MTEEELGKLGENYLKGLLLKRHKWQSVLKPKNEFAPVDFFAVNNKSQERIIQVKTKIEHVLFRNKNEWRQSANVSSFNNSLKVQAEYGWVCYWFWIVLNEGVFVQELSVLDKTKIESVNDEEKYYWPVDSLKQLTTSVRRCDIIKNRE